MYTLTNHTAWAQRLLPLLLKAEKFNVDDMKKIKISFKVRRAGY